MNLKKCTKLTNIIHNTIAQTIQLRSQKKIRDRLPCDIIDLIKLRNITRMICQKTRFREKHNCRIKSINKNSNRKMEK